MSVVRGAGLEPHGRPPLSDGRIPRIDIPRHTFGMYFAIAFILSGGAICFFIAAISRDSVVGRLVLAAIGVAISLPMAIRMIGHLRIFFAEDGVHQARLVGKEIPWSSATVRRVSATDLEISGSGGEKIRVVITQFKDPAQLGRILEERIRQRACRIVRARR